MVSATQPYTVIWEALDPYAPLDQQAWHEIGRGDLLEIYITEESAALQYRITLMGEDKQCVSSSPYMMPEIDDFWIEASDEEDEEIAEGEEDFEEEETEEAEEPAEDEVTEEPAEEETEEPAEDEVTEKPAEEATEAPAEAEVTEAPAEEAEPTAVPAEENTEEPAEAENETETEPAAEPAAETPTEESSGETPAEEITEAEVPGEEMNSGEQEETEEPEKEPAPEEPAEEAEPDSAEEEAEQPEPAAEDEQPAETPAPVERKVIVHSSLDGVENVYEGTKVTLTGELIGYEGLDYRLQWYFRKDGIGDYILIEGADQLTFTYRIDQENYHNSYHLGVFLMDFTMSGD